MSRFTVKITKTSGKNKKKNKPNFSIAILTAGVGARIKSYEPRSMLRIGDKTLIECQIEALKNLFHDTEIVGVVGFDAQRIIKKLNGKPIRIIENQMYETTNTSESLRLAFNNNIQESFMFIHGDLLFNSETFADLDFSQSFILVDNQNRFDSKEVGVTVDNNNTANILSYGLNTKWCQIAYITGKELKIAKNLFNKFEEHDKKMLSFEVLNKMISMGACFKCHEPKNMKIIEIDRIKDISK
jgi:choline kinase